MTVIQLPEVVFSTPAFPLPTFEKATSSSGLWRSNGLRGAPGGGYYDQVPALDGTTSGTKADLLTSDSSLFAHADSKAFNLATYDPSWGEGFTIYTFTVFQDEPLEFSLPYIKSGQLFLELQVTMRQPIGGMDVQAAFEVGRAAYDEPVSFYMADPEAQVPTADWATYTYNMTYDGFGSFAITDGQFPSWWTQFSAALAQGKLMTQLIFGGEVLGSIDIAHIKLGGHVDYVGTTITGSRALPRARFGRA